MTSDPLHPRLEDAAPPRPPERLRAAALGAAARAWDERPDVWSRLWENRPARLAWAAAVLALVASHLWLGASGPGSVAAAPATTLADGGGPGLEEVTDVLEVRIAPIAWIGDGLSRTSTAQPRRSPDRRKERS